MRRSSKFSNVLEATSHLSLEEKETLLEVLRHRTVEERRKQLKREIAGSQREHSAGKTKPASPRRIVRDLRVNN
jgi:hypothetical protein